MNELVAAIETLAYRAWPAQEEVEIDGWMLRRSPGLAARRINSATSPLGDPGTPGAMEPVIRRWFVARDAEPVVRILSASAPAIDRHFDAAGWRRESPTVVMTAPVRPDGGAGVDRIDRELSQPWVDAKRRLTGMSATVIETWQRRAAAITGITGFASIARPRGVVAIGLGVVDDGWLGLFDLNTDPAYRRRGLGRTIVRSLEVWAAALGASSAYLQVEEDNGPALALYRGAGYESRYEYWYRRAPDGGGVV